METSAKTNVNIRELFLVIARKLPKESNESQNSTFILDEDDYGDGEKKGGCCVIL